MAQYDSATASLDAQDLGYFGGRFHSGIRLILLCWMGSEVFFRAHERTSKLLLGFKGTPSPRLHGSLSEGTPLGSTPSSAQLDGHERWRFWTGRNGSAFGVFKMQGGSEKITGQTIGNSRRSARFSLVR